MARPVLNVRTVGGIDPNSHKIAIVETRKIDRVKPFIHVVLLTGEIEERSSQAFDYICDFCISVKERDGSYPRLFLEAPIQGRGGPGSTIPQAFISGAIMAGAVQGGSQIALINNQTWKKRVIGNGNVNKLDVSEWVEDHWPLLFEKTPVIENLSQGHELQGRPDQDILDAGCLSKFGWKHVSMVERLGRRRNG
jgi:Holliday junction resolvasome RuvABC endonuclease subunit